jgi:AcrR family transcriptional regulator
MATNVKPAPKKRGDASVTRAKILEVAREVFMERAYEQVGMREIAGRAGVTAAMITRYFGTKEALFTEVIGDFFSFQKFLEVERSSFGANLASLVIQNFDSQDPHHTSHFAPQHILLRSAGDKGAPVIIQELLDTQVWRPLIAWLGGENAPERAELIVCTMMGFIIMHKKIGGPTQSQTDEKRLTALLARALQSYVDD